MKIISFAETGNDLRTVLEVAAEAEDALTVLRENGSSLVILTLEQYNGLMETSHLLIVYRVGATLLPLSPAAITTKNTVAALPCHARCC